MLRWAVLEQNGPVAIRYPRGGDRDFTASHWNGDDSFSVHRQGTHITVITYGTLISTVMEAAAFLADRGIEVTVLRAMCLTDIDPEALTRLLAPSDKVFVAEEAMAGSGIRGEIAALLPGHRVFGADLGDNFVTHGSMKALYAHYGLDAQSLSKKIAEVVRLEN